MFTGKTKIDKAIQANLNRWQALVHNPVGPTNEVMAEQAIRQLYNIVLKKNPGLIVWCDSPYQMATIPVLITNVAESKNWTDVCARMSQYPLQDVAWDQQWCREWQQLLETDLKDLIPKVLLRHDFYSIEESAFNATVAKLKAALRVGLATRVLQPGSMASKKPQKKPAGRPLRAPHELEFLKQQMQLFKKVETVAGLEINPLNINSYLSLGNGFDPRWLTKLVPATKDVLLVKQEPYVSESCERIRRGCTEFERRCLQMSTWYARLPGREPLPVADFSIDPEKLPDAPQVFSMLARGVAQMQENFKRVSETLDAPIPWIIWMPFAVTWLPFALSCRIAFPDILQNLDEEIDCWALLAHAAAGYCLTETVAFACKKPLICHLNQSLLPHCDYGPAMIWKDSYSVYSWRGVLIRSELLNDRQAITIDKISNNKNAEIRRVMIEIYGEASYLEDAGAMLIDKNLLYGELYKLDLRGDEPLCMVKVRNSTAEPDGTYKNYFLRVPPSMKTAQEAVAWTFGMTEAQYHPQFES